MKITGNCRGRHTNEPKEYRCVMCNCKHRWQCEVDIEELRASMHNTCTICSVASGLVLFGLVSELLGNFE